MQNTIWDVVALVLALAIAWQALWSRAGSSIGALNIPPILQAGGQIGFRDVVWDEADQHVLLFISTTCPATLRSVPFYRRLADQLFREGRQLTILSSDPKMEVDAWLASQRLPSASRFIAIKDPVAFGLVVTPTVLRVNPRGIVSDVLVGYVSQDRASEFIQRMKGEADEPLDNSAELLAEEVDTEGFEALIQERRWVVVDVREHGEFEQGHRSSAINIPFDELLVRAPIEIPPKAPVVIDCSRAATYAIPACRAAGMYFRSAGGRDTVVHIAFPTGR
jgi:rhodanese-related sulfurtransferase